MSQLAFNCYLLSYHCSWYIPVCTLCAGSQLSLACMERPRAMWKMSTTWQPFKAHESWVMCHRKICNSIVEVNLHFFAIHTWQLSRTHMMVVWEISFVEDTTCVSWKFETMVVRTFLSRHVPNSRGNVVCSKYSGTLLHYINHHSGSIILPPTWLHGLWYIMWTYKECHSSRSSCFYLH